MSDTITLTTTINLKKSTVYASPTALRKAGLQSNSKDKGITVNYTSKDGEAKQYQAYSVFDAKPLAKPTKVVGKVAPEATRLKQLDALLSSKKFTSAAPAVQVALIQAIQ